MAESILFSGWLASLMLIVSVSLAGYWVVGHRKSKRKRNSSWPKLSKPEQQDRKAKNRGPGKGKPKPTLPRAPADNVEDCATLLMNYRFAEFRKQPPSAIFSELRRELCSELKLEHIHP